MTPLRATCAVLGLLALACTSSVAEARYDVAVGTSYCLRGTMADGTQTRSRSAASNTLKLGTRIRLTRAAGPRGMRRYVIRDRIGHGTELDLWTPSCADAIRWGRRTLHFKIGWR